MTDIKPLLTDEEIRDEAEEFTVNPISTDSFRQGFRLGSEYTRSIYEADRAKLLDEIEVLKLAKQELRDGLIKVGALLETALPKEGE